MKTMCSSETWFQFIELNGLNIPDYGALHCHRYMNLKSCKNPFFLRKE
jgi:hypothetical protein